MNKNRKLTEMTIPWKFSISCFFCVCEAASRAAGASCLPLISVRSCCENLGSAGLFILSCYLYLNNKSEVKTHLEREQRTRSGSNPAPLIAQRPAVMAELISRLTGAPAGADMTSALDSVILSMLFKRC